ncbi:hypothetical protein SKAU_G00043810 [Synaphobranchus kaupii]|uniref:Uncharacterized protein n=1 Tax=Synaphobranchus kaupii TaxID=118154 RepID=A0A9Q1J7Z9_SYNKA|nr:hypothetical protein SKAU_G00043810 [Synaphobranchus kaupii]
MRKRRKKKNRGARLSWRDEPPELTRAYGARRLNAIANPSRTTARCVAMGIRETADGTADASEHIRRWREPRPRPLYLAPSYDSIENTLSPAGLQNRPLLTSFPLINR